MNINIERINRQPRYFRDLKPGDLFGIPTNDKFLAIVTEPEQRYNTFNAMVISNEEGDDSVFPGCGTHFYENSEIQLVDELKVVVIS